MLPLSRGWAAASERTEVSDQEKWKPSQIPHTVSITPNSVLKVLGCPYSKRNLFTSGYSSVFQTYLTRTHFLHITYFLLMKLLGNAV